MASAVTSNLPAAAPVPVPYGWLIPRASISRDVADPVATPEPAISKDFIDFEFSGLGGSATMLPADELFADGKLLPLRKAAPSPDPEAAPPPARPEEAMPAPRPSGTEPIKPLRAAAAADGADPCVFSPKAPSCSGRWRELLGLKRASDARSPSAAKGLKASAAARSLKLLLQRNAGRAAVSDLASAPLLLRDSSDSEASLSLASSRVSLSSSSSSSGHDDAPRLSLDSAAADPNPPRIRLVRSSHHRHSTSSARSPARRRPSPPRCVSVDSPRMNSSGKIVFQAGLERSSSSPCSFHAHAASKPRSRAVDRSYSSAGVVRVAPVVLNVPVCPRPVFGFFKDRKDSCARSSLGRRAPPPPPQGCSGELAR